MRWGCGLPTQELLDIPVVKVRKTQNAGSVCESSRSLGQELELREWTPGGQDTYVPAPGVNGSPPRSRLRGTVHLPHGPPGDRKGPPRSQVQKLVALQSPLYDDK